MSTNIIAFYVTKYQSKLTISQQEKYRVKNIRIATSEICISLKLPHYIYITWLSSYINGVYCASIVKTEILLELGK